VIEKLSQKTKPPKAGDHRSNGFSGENCKWEGKRNFALTQWKPKKEMPFKQQNEGREEVKNKFSETVKERVKRTEG